MIVQMKVPAVGESIQEVEIVRWLKQEGDLVQRDEDIVEVESEKATLSIPAPTTGRIVKIQKRDGEMAEVGEVIAEIDHEARPEQNEVAGQQIVVPDKPPAQKPEVAALNSPERAADPIETVANVEALESAKLVTRDRTLITSAPGEQHDQKLESAARTAVASREETIVPMSMIRRHIAARLVEAQKNSALVTTINEIDMSEVIALRSKLRQPFQEQYGVKLGFMSFFVKAAIEALERFPEVNAEVRGNDVVFHNYYDVGIAIGGGKGLVVPVLRNADQLSFAEVESAIDDFANRAVNHKLRPEELTGGTFTISNGGVYGSLLSTPIINPPQSGVLGLHAIQDRPVARKGEVVIRPMMYVALTYDHRIVDGREAVGFLGRIKDLVEQPSRILLEV